MSVELSPSDFRQLLRIVQNLPEFTNVRDRYRLVAGALEGIPQTTDSILARLYWEGTPMGAASEVIHFLADFGQVAYGKESLGVFLNYIQPFVGDKDASFIGELFERYPLDVPVVPGRPIDYWRGEETPSDVQEKIIGEDTLRHIRILELALEAAKAIVHLKISSDGKISAGTGFMITPDMLMTNHHVLHAIDEALSTEYTFNYQLNREGQAAEITTVSALSEGFFHTNPDLDYTVVQLKEPPDFGSPLSLKAEIVRRDNRVAIIQHPGGHLKKISMQNNFVVYADQQVVQYTTSTLPGSSGSPVFNDDFEVIAIHHSGGMLLEPGTRQRYLRNAGTSMIAILKDLKANALEIYNCLYLKG